MTLLFSVLIPTVTERRPLLVSLLADLRRQTETHRLEEAVEILHLQDEGQQKVGAKRNELVRMAQGRHIAFIDDDDQVSDQYLSLICGALQSNPDCVGFRGVMVSPNRPLLPLVHSLQYKTMFELGGVAYRPPNHLNPIRRDVALSHPFPEKSRGEDTDYCMSIVRSDALKTEVFINQELYIYRFDPRRSLTQQPGIV